MATKRPPATRPSDKLEAEPSTTESPSTSQPESQSPVTTTGTENGTKTNKATLESLAQQIAVQNEKIDAILDGTRALVAAQVATQKQLKAGRF